MKKTGEKLLCILERIFGTQFYRGSRAAMEMELLYPGKEGQQRIRAYFARKFLRMLGLLLAGGLLFAVLMFTRAAADLEERLIRNSYGSHERQVEMQAETDKGDRYAVQVTVSPRMYTDAEAKEVLEKAAQDLETQILGENDSIDHVYYDLNLITELKEGPVQISWTCSNYGIIGLDGTIQAEEISKEGCPVYLKAVMTCGTQEREFSRMAVVYPKPLSEDERFEQHLHRAVADADRKSRTETGLELPGEVDGQHLVWREVSAPYGWALLLLVPAAMAAVFYVSDERLHDRLRRRMRQMDADYAEILNKLVLLLGAGMTVRASWERITEDYSRYSQEKHFAYEEMIRCVNEMKQGVPEITAYEHFGRRCASPAYMKLSALLVQNLRKGSSGMLEVFRRESAEALDARRHYAKQKGEEAGTKLLFPMFLMLAVVLVMVMVPAFRSIRM